MNESVLFTITVFIYSLLIIVGYYTIVVVVGDMNNEGASDRPNAWLKDHMSEYILYSVVNIFMYVDPKGKECNTNWIYLFV